MAGQRKAAVSLLPHHQQLLTASAIDPAVAAARGYRSVTSRAELAQLGFEDFQRHIPALLIPVHDVTGKVATHQIRPDTPRQNGDGKPIKYETPTGTRLVLDVPPAVRPQLGDPSVRLYISEGARKVDAAVSAGLCAIGVAGVFGWRGRNDAGGKVALPDWELVAINGRQVALVFDSDLATNANVRAALERLKGFLELRGAKVTTVYLPAGPDGVKVGLDDWLAAGHTAAELEALAPAEAMPRPLFRTVREILEDPARRETPEVVVPFFVFAGRVTLLAAREKLGKSTLARAFARAVSCGSIFLGVPVTAGDVLILSLEEHRDDAANQLEMFGVDQDRVVVNDYPPPDPLAALEVEAYAHPRRLIIVDSLAKLASGLVKEAGASAQWQPLLDRLLRIARETGTGLLIIVHSPKSIAELYRDSSAIGAFADGIVGMKSTPDGGRIREFEVQARWRCGKFSVRLDGDLEGDESDPPRYHLVAGGELSRDGRVLAYVAANPRCSKHAAKKVAGGRSVAAGKFIDSLVASGVLKNVGAETDWQLVLDTSGDGWTTSKDPVADLFPTGTTPPHEQEPVCSGVSPLGTRAEQVGTTPGTTPVPDLFPERDPCNGSLRGQQGYAGPPTRPGDEIGHVDPDDGEVL